jgi:hypothetical protein
MVESIYIASLHVSSRVTANAKPFTLFARTTLTSKFKQRVSPSGLPSILLSVWVAMRRPTILPARQ